MFSLLEQSEDFYEVKIIERIKDDYDRFHKHDFIMFEEMISNIEFDVTRLFMKAEIRQNLSR